MGLTWISANSKECAEKKNIDILEGVLLAFLLNEDPALDSLAGVGSSI